MTRLFPSLPAQAPAHAFYLGYGVYGFRPAG